MQKRTELLKYQNNFIEELGILVLPIQGGQIRRYGPSIYSFEIIDMYNQYEFNELLEICANKIHRARLPISSSLGLVEQVMEFKKIGTFTYYYKTGQDYTG